MIQPHKPQPATLDDDLDLDLPDEDEPGLREDEEFSPEDDDDLGLDDDDENDVGLDSDTGLDDAPDEGEGGEEEEGSWLDNGELEPGLREDDDDDDDDDESLTEGGEPGNDAGDDFEDDVSFDENIGAIDADSGEEGFGEDSTLNEVDIDRLPPLDDALAADTDDAIDTDTDAFTGDLIGGLTTRAEAEEQLEEIAPGVRLPRLPAERVSVESLLRLGRPLTSLVAAGDTGVGWDGSLLVADAAAVRPDRRFAGADAAFALAATQMDGALLVGLATPAGLLCSRDGGHVFTNAAALPEGDWSASAIAWTAGVDGPRLWAAPPGGALWASDDFGATLTRCGPEAQVLRLRSDARTTVVALCRRPDGGASALGSNDGGRSFAWLDLPVREVERMQDVQACGGVVLCSRRAPAPQLVWRMAAHDWVELAPQASAPAVLVDEDEQVSAYFFVNAGGRRLLLRRELAARAPGPRIVCELPADAGAPLQLAAHQQGGVTTLQLGGERAWYRVRVRLSGEDA